MAGWILPNLDCNENKKACSHSDCAMGTRLTLLGKKLALIFLCLSSPCRAEEVCDVVVKVHSIGLSPSSFKIKVAPKASTICLHDQLGREWSFNIGDLYWDYNGYEKVYNTFDYNISLFTKSNECKMESQRVDNQSGQTITEYQCNYESTEDAEKCAYVTKPNRKGDGYSVYSWDGNQVYKGRESGKRTLLIYETSKHKMDHLSVTTPGTYKLNWPEYFQQSNVTLFVSMGWKTHFQYFRSLLVSSDEKELYFIKNPTADHPAHGELGDYYLNFPVVKYSDPSVQCVPFDRFSCHCAVEERSMVSFLESRKSDFQKPSVFTPLQIARYAALQDELYEIDVQLTLATP